MGYNTKREVLKRSEDKDVKLLADNSSMYITWVNELQVQIHAPNSGADNILKSSLELIRTLTEEN